MKIFRIVSFGLLAVVLFVLGFQLGVRYEWNALEYERRAIEALYTLAGDGETVQNDPEQEVDLSLFWGVWRLLSQYYIEPEDLTIDDMVYGSIGGMVHAVGDPYTVFMTPDDTDDFENAMSGTLEGIGAQMDQVNGDIIVVSPLKGSPAEAAGLLPQDIVLTVDEEDITGMRLDQVVDRIRGPAGTTVDLGIYREGADDILTISIKRQSIHIPSVEFDDRDGVAILTINQFGDSTLVEVYDYLRKLDAESVNGLVLDLRFNGGGYLEGAVELTSAFLQDGVVVTVERRGVEPEVFVAFGDALFPDVPMAVLINAGTASAAEIVAGALQDHDRAIVIGTTSFGKGTVQEIVDLPNGAALRVTTARWLTPSGHDLGEEGIQPDREVERTIEQYRAGEDPQLDAAIRALQ